MLIGYRNLHQKFQLSNCNKHNIKQNPDSERPMNLKILATMLEHTYLISKLTLKVKPLQTQNFISEAQLPKRVLGFERLDFYNS